MCFFIAIGIESNSIEFLRKAAGVEMALSEAGNPAFDGLLPNRYSFFWLTLNGCACDLISKDRETTAELERKFKRRGWSPNKIKRVIADKRMTGSPKGKHLFAAILKAAIQSSNPFYLFLKWFEGDVDSEKVHVSGERHIRFEDFNGEDVRKYENLLLKLEKP